MLVQINWPVILIMLGILALFVYGIYKLIAMIINSQK